MTQEATDTPTRRGARPLGDRPMTDAERSRRYRRRHSTTRLLRLPADPADRLTAEADRLGVDPVRCWPRRWRRWRQRDGAEPDPVPHPTAP